MATPARTPYPQAAKELLRDSLMDAAGELLAERDWGEISMADVAQAAGVSRQTLYNEFGSRDEFAMAFVMREGDRFIIAVEQAINARSNDPTGALEAAFNVFLDAAAENPLVRSAVFGGGAESLLPMVTTRGQPLVERAAERITEIIRANWPQVRLRDAELLAEAMVRLAISYATLPHGPARMTAASVTELLGPFIERAVARSG